VAVIPAGVASAAPADPRALATAGQDAEASALSRAVRWHSERRVLLNGHSTVVFR